MTNVVVLNGRLTKDIELKFTSGNLAFCKFNLAVKDNYKDKTHFINCVAWKKQAEILNEYAAKGHRVGITGTLQTGNYKDKDGKTVYTTDVLVTGIDLINGTNTNNTSQQNDDAVMEYEDDDEEFPF